MEGLYPTIFNETPSPSRISRPGCQSGIYYFKRDIPLAVVKIIKELDVARVSPQN